MKKEKDLTGTRIKVAKKIEAGIEAETREMDISRELMEEGAKKLKEARQKMFAIIEKHHPIVKHYQYTLSKNKNEYEITLKYKSVDIKQQLKDMKGRGLIT